MKEPVQGKWQQVSGDMSFDSVGCILGRDDGGGWVELVKIDPWLELDSSALKEGYGFWDVSTASIHYNDMGLDKRNVKEALKYVGMEPDEYEQLAPIYKAEIIASYSGYEDSRSSSDYADALPAPIEEIEFWAGPGSKFNVESINDEMRHEVVYKVYGGDFDEDTLPDDDALELAWGEDKPHTFEITEDQAQAVRYAYAWRNNTFDWPIPKPDDTKLIVANMATFKTLLENLRDCPDSSSLPAEDITMLQAAYAGTFNLDWEDKREQTAYMIDEDAKEARNLIKDLLGTLGF
jgi:hypothetical protein